MKTVQELNEIARSVRIDALKGIYAAGAGHPGGSFSVTDILVSLYFNVMNVDPEDPKMENRDRLVLSKGHAAPALYATLAHRGFLIRLSCLPFAGSDPDFRGIRAWSYVPELRCLPGLWDRDSLLQ